MKHTSSFLVAGSLSFVAASIAAPQFHNGLDFPNSTGVARTVTSAGRIELTGPFFQNLGTNGRRCVTCHVPGENWSVSARGVRERFDLSRGMDPIFRLNDGSNSPLSDVSTLAARRRAYSMLINRGVIRVERPIPANAEFALTAVDDPYGYASASGLSLFRRPLPTTNLRFISTVMWDGREVDPQTPMTIQNSEETNRQILLDSLSHQALDATNGHAQGAHDLTVEQRNRIVEFEMGLATAQVIDFHAGPLMANGASGGPSKILGLPFYIGINDNVNDPNGPFNAIAMTLYDSWANSQDSRRSAVARGQSLFNTMPITIRGVKGLNDNPYFGNPETVVGTCTTCHNTPNVGDHSLAIALDIGIADAIRRTSDMPLYTLRNKTTGETTQTTDPGLALSTGRWKDVGRFKGPVLRGLSGRAPYFHNGSAADLGAVVDFYKNRFGFPLTARERADLVAFLQAL